MSFFKPEKRNQLPIRNNTMEGLRRRDGISDLFEDFFDSWNTFPTTEKKMSEWIPAMNVHESKDAYHVETELPGVKKEDVHVEVKNNYLIIKGEKKSFDEQKKDNYHHVERSHGSFYRSIALPKDADKERVSAEMRDGMLILDIAKNQTIEQQRRVEIK